MYSRAHAQAKGVLNSFVQFVGWMGRDGLELTGASLASRLERHCGRPCRYDYLLRTESLAADWLRLVEALGLPRHALPRVNEANDLGRWGNGLTEVALTESSDFTYIMGLVRQAFEYQMGGD